MFLLFKARTKRVSALNGLDDAILVILFRFHKTVKVARLATY
jgi:hypothetical protein